VHYSVIQGADKYCIIILTFRQITDSVTQMWHN